MTHNKPITKAYQAWTDKKDRHLYESNPFQEMDQLEARIEGILREKLRRRLNFFEIEN
jgi:hypothetical protein